MSRSPRVTKHCLDCGGAYRVPANNAVQSTRCPDCQRAHHNKTRKYQGQRYLKQPAPMAFKIIYSPDGCWPRGAQFDFINAYETARLGHFAPGTMLEHRTPEAIKTIVVVGDYFKNQTFKTIKKEEI